MFTPDPCSNVRRRYRGGVEGVNREGRVERSPESGTARPVSGTEAFRTLAAGVFAMADTRSRSPLLSSPTTTQGRRAGRLFAVAAILVVCGIGLAGLWFGLLEEPGGDQESPPLPLVIPMFLAALGGMAAAITGGVFAVLAIRRGDRSGILALPLIAFLFALTFIVGEFAVPH